MTIIDLSFMLTHEDRHAWRDKAVCAQTDPEVFFPENGVNATSAKKICKDCEVRAQCLQWALENDEQFGVFGGLSPHERRPLRKAVKASQPARPSTKPCKYCGTEFTPPRARVIYCSMDCVHADRRTSFRRRAS
ncbi:WhiB [Mycobacterium phage Ritam007]|nr:WhiB protein [Mycobacterium phage Saroj]UZV39586.1 WhiB [Mycobacterium phage Ritam007]